MTAKKIELGWIQIVSIAVCIVLGIVIFRFGLGLNSIIGGMVGGAIGGGLGQILALRQAKKGK